MKKKIKKILSIFLVSITTVMIPIFSTTAYQKSINFNKENFSTNSNDDEKIIHSKVEFLENLNNLYVEKEKIYTIEEANALFDTLENKIQEKAKRFAIDYSNFENKKNLENNKKINFYANSYWSFIVLKVFFNLDECKEISRYANEISVGLSAGSLAISAAPVAPFVTAALSLGASLIDSVFSNPGKNGIYIAFFMGFIPVCIEKY